MCDLTVYSPWRSNVPTAIQPETWFSYHLLQLKSTASRYCPFLPIIYHRRSNDFKENHIPLYGDLPIHHRNTFSHPYTECWPHNSTRTQHLRCHTTQNPFWYNSWQPKSTACRYCLFWPTTYRHQSHETWITTLFYFYFYFYKIKKHIKKKQINE